MINPLHFICQYFDVDWQKIKKLAPFLLALNLIYFFPLINQSTPYLDDLEWAIFGQTDHTGNGRLLGDFLSSILNFNFDFSHNYIIYSGALLQIISICLLSFAATVFYLRINNKKPNLYLAMLIFSFAANPFLLTSLSYKSACLHGVISISLALLASLDFKHRVLNIPLGFVLLLIMLNIYQLSLNIYLSATLLLFLLEFKRDIRTSLIFLYNNILKAFFAILTYKLILYSLAVKLSRNGLLRSEMINLDEHFFKQVFENSSQYIDKIIYSFEDSTFLVFFALISIIAFGIKYVFHNNDHKITSTLVFILCSFGIFFCSFGILIFFTNSLIIPRLIIGFSPFLTFIFFAFDKSIAERIPSLKILVIVPLLYFTFISFSYNSIIQAQYRFNYSIMQQMENRLEDLGIKSSDKVYLNGSLGYSPIASNSVSRNKLLSFLQTYQGFIGEGWFTNLFSKHMGFKRNFKYLPRKKQRLPCSTQSLYSNPFYKINRVKDEYFITFPDGKCFTQR